MSDAGNPIDNLDKMNRQESGGDAECGADDIPSLNLDEMLSGSCPTTSSARNGGIAKSEEEEKNASNDASSPPVPEGDGAAVQANQIILDKDKLIAVLTKMERNTTSGEAAEMVGAFRDIFELN